MKRSIYSMALGATGVLAASSEPGFATSRPPISTIEPTLSSIIAAQATAQPLSPTSNVQGASFDRIIQIWLENTNYEAAAADPNFQWVASQGITLTNYYAVTHPSEPNYAAVVGGDYFGIDNDDFLRVPENVSTVVDLLDTRGISWGEYQEHLPYPGFQGFNFSNQDNYAADYVRKHNPLILFDSVVNNATRLALIKNLTSFNDDLNAQKLPQWSFITPNMTNDAHDTNVTFTGTWTRRFLEPLLNNSYFMDKTLIVVSFDENEVYSKANRVFTVLLGGAIDKSLHGTNDTLYYNHYSTISTVSVNWGLPSLGRWDCDANVFAFVANKTGYKNTNISLDGLYFNSSYPGALSDKEYTAGWWPAPNTQAKCASGKGVLPSIVSRWGNSTGTYNYTNVYPYDQNSGVGTGGTPTTGTPDGGSGTSSGGSGPGASGSTTGSAPGATKSSSASAFRPEVMSFVGILGLAAAFL